MARLFKTAHRVHSALGFFPKLRKKIDSICVDFHRIQENFSYEADSNGERWLLQTLARQKLLNTVFDVGANHGDWTRMVLAANHDATVHCFEICPPTFDILAKNLAAHKKNVFLNALGLSDAAGEITLKYNPNSDHGTTMFEPVFQQELVEVKGRVVSGQDYCAEHKITKIDFLKIDVEGAEHLVLNGFGERLTPANVPVIQFEYGMLNIHTKFLLKDFYAFFESRGYKVGKLLPANVRFRNYQLQDEDFLGPNYIAASPQAAGLLGSANVS